MEKKIIGYKLKQGCEQFEKAAVYMIRSHTASYKEAESFEDMGLPGNGCLFENGSLSETVLRKAGVLDLWFEPLYDSIIPEVGKWYITKGYSKEYDGVPLKVTVISGEYCHFENSFSKNHNFSKFDIQRKATEEEVEKYLIDMAKSKGIWGVPITSASGNPGIKPFFDECFCLQSNILWSKYGEVYEDGKWATAFSGKTVLMGHTFELSVTNDGIFHNSENITKFVKQLVNYFSLSSIAGYEIGISNIVFNRTGCEKVHTTLSEWKNVLEAYYLLKK